MRYIQGQPRRQATLLPELVDDFVAEDHPVRVIDAFVDSLDIPSLGFTHSQPKQTGRKAYHPGDLLKLYLYGYLNQVRSSRRLERECQRNVEVMWLLGRLHPDFKTIANFRKDNGVAVRQASLAFVLFCREAELIGGERVALDGSKFKAAASKGRALTRKQLEGRLKKVDGKIERYLKQLDEADRQEGGESIDRAKVERIVESLKQRKGEHEAMRQAMDEVQRDQYCTTEPDARLMRSGREGMVVGYNLQSVVDEKHKLIIHHELGQDGGDNRQLLPMAEQTKELLESESLEVLADGGYSNGEQLAECEQKGIEVTVPVNRAVNNQGEHFQKERFSYDAESDSYFCPAGEQLHHKTYSTKDKLHLYTTERCGECPLKDQCTKGKQRWVSRHFHEQALENAQARMKRNPEAMKQRQSLVEHPFGTLKRRMGNGRLLCWGLKAARCEMAISVLSYNLTRAINTLGGKALLARLA